MKFLGKDAEARTSRVGRDHMDLDYTLSLKNDAPPPTDFSRPDDKKKKFFHYFHSTGKEMLEIQLDKEREEEEKQNAIIRAAHAHQLLRRHIKVSENEERAGSVRIDTDWNTTAWTDEMIEAGCEVLFGIFSEENCPKARKVKAVEMLEKLQFRHKVAQAFVRRNLEVLVGRAISRFIRKGKCAGQLDLLYILHSARIRFIENFSDFNFTGKAFEMMLAEARLASIIIQHAFRAKLDSFRPRPQHGIVTRFGGEAEMRNLRQSSIQARSADLRELWKNLHYAQTTEMRSTVGGFRGPAHIDEDYMMLMLEIVSEMVSKAAGGKAFGNREDVLNSNGVVMLATFVSNPLGRYAYIALQILANTSKVSKSVGPMLELGCPSSSIKFIRFLRETGKLQWMVLGTDGMYKSRNMSEAARKAKSVHKFAFFDCILLYTKLAIHAAALARARANFGYLKPAKDDMEPRNYLIELEDLKGRLASKVVIKQLADAPLIRTLIMLLLENRHLVAMRSLLMLLFSIACSEGHGPVLFELVAMSGAAMIRVLELIEEQDVSTSTLALCLFLQIATLQEARETLLVSNISVNMAPFIRCTSTTIFSSRPYLRAILITSALLRQHEWRAYDPEELPAFLADSETIRKAVYLDLLKTIKQPSLIISNDLSISDLVVMPNADPNSSLEMSKAAEAIGGQELADFLTHPGDAKHAENLVWEEAVAGCVILEALTKHPGTAENLLASVYSVGFYLGKCIFISRFMFIGKPPSDRRLLVILHGVRAASRALESLCQAAAQGNHLTAQEDICEAIEDVDMIGAVQFFIGTLSVHQTELEPSLLELQQVVGNSVIAFFKHYSKLLVQMSYDASTAVDAIRRITDLSPAAVAIMEIIKSLENLYGKQPDLKFLFFDGLCSILVNITTPIAITAEAVTNWKIVAALREHLPPPLTAIGEKGADDELYARGLGQMPSSLFDLLTNLTRVDKGKMDCLSDGFLRRALDKFTLLFPKLCIGGGGGRRSVVGSTNDEHEKEAAEVVEEEKEVLNVGDLEKHRQEASCCLALIAKCANFTNFMYGSSNDLVLFPSYKIPEKCRDIVVSDKIACQDALNVNALGVLASISGDTVRLCDVFEDINILKAVRGQLGKVETLPQEAVESCMQIVFSVANGLASDYLRIEVPALREPLTKVTRYFPAFADKINDVLWVVAKSTFNTERDELKEKRNLDAGWNPHKFTVANDVILNQRFKVMLEEAGMDSKEVMRGSNQNSHDTSRDSTRPSSAVSPIKVSPSSAITKRRSSLQALFDGDIAVLPPSPGNATFCGPTNCGSLRSADTPTQHGAYAKLDEVERARMMIQSLPRVTSKQAAAESSKRLPSVVLIKPNKAKGDQQLRKPGTTSVVPMSPISRKNLLLPPPTRRPGSAAPIIFVNDSTDPLQRTRPPVNKEAAYYC